MKDLFYKGNTKLCGTLQNSVFFPCVTPIPEWLKKAIEKSLSEKKGNIVAKYGKEKPIRNTFSQFNSATTERP